MKQANRKQTKDQITKELIQGLDSSKLGRSNESERSDIGNFGRNSRCSSAPEGEEGLQKLEGSAKMSSEGKIHGVAAKSATGASRNRGAPKHYLSLLLNQVVV